MKVFKEIYVKTLNSFWEKKNKSQSVKFGEKKGVEIYHLKMQVEF